MKLGLFTRFATLSFLCVAALAAAMGFALSLLLTRAVSEWEWENTAALVQREVEFEEMDALFAEPIGPEAKERWSGRIRRLFTGFPEIVRVKVWDRAGHGGPIELLLTDVVMPGMSGIELAGRLTALRPDIRTLFTSGYAGDRLGHPGHGGAPPDLLQKPFTPETLARRVRQALDAG